MTGARATPPRCERTNTSKQSALRRHPGRADVEMPRNARQYSDEISEIWDAADREGRDLTSGERAHVEQLIESAKSMHSIEQQMRELGGNAPEFVTRTDPNHSFTGGGPGDVFVKSAGYQRIQDASGRGQTWTTGPVEVSKTPLMHRMPASNAFEMYKGTLLETGVGGPGGGLVGRARRGVPAV